MSDETPRGRDLGTTKVTSKRTALKRARELNEEYEAATGRVKVLREVISARLESDLDSYEISMDGGAGRKFKHIPFAELRRMLAEEKKEAAALMRRINALTGNGEPDYILVEF